MDYSLENESDTHDQTFHSTLMLTEDGSSLTEQIIPDYFTSDGLRTRTLDSCNDEPVLAGSGGEEQKCMSKGKPQEVEDVDVLSNAPVNHSLAPIAQSGLTRNILEDNTYMYTHFIKLQKK
ncbi:hypothetical protein CCR75_003950 [Bremia lactucae]|uniref:Uncharacterized protein n=1 Tax=Bremia lactucae TaxID=4779 RepID=A0A976FMQ4_BRELC|nr:hypothetical protein CCR75_003950 [Bremia lactucae]